MAHRTVNPLDSRGWIVKDFCYPAKSSMEDLQQKHRKEQRDLQSLVTQKKKNATKKTRKSVLDECVQLEKQLKERQSSELAQLNDENTLNDDANVELDVIPSIEISTQDPTSDIETKLASVSVATNSASNGESKKPNRQKARLARRAAEQEAATRQAEQEAADLPNLREKEIQSMRKAYEAKGLIEHDIRSDGHCLYAAIADQLQNTGLQLKPKITLELDSAKKPDYAVTRQVAAAYIAQHSDDFVPFLEQPLDEYLRTIRETGEWGGHLEILALARAYSVDIKVLHGNGHVDTIESGTSEDEPLWLAYYRHSYGLGEHYNSLRRSK
ncbi:uncharacterized protein KY384_006101 [Bacidia gigantensis]|uniref:uncharacterized protein n=1 Tax=Bacidia gigantensis TaxID=2732470 RepID=UPI001D054A3C|nr:uncharacterized protein KY384_006101 [Bacidia gigantensis]KAG8529464.1 hypothetical protein KY384_006101 [Bacidia gigantensis]